MGREIPKVYEPEGVEERLYRWWEEEGFFQADPERGSPSFSMAIPPPNVTGSLHMGHALNHTLQDILARWKRMQGYNVLWLPGTDHAGIATQNVVERRLAEQGKHRTDYSREEFEKIVWEWKEVAERNILGQIRRLGCSCDWSRKRFTFDEGLSRAVREVFVQLYEDGLIYRDEYLVNWCPRCATAISDLEVEYKNRQGHLWHLRYPIVDSDAVLVVATTRPETMLGDTAVAVHPEDERYRHLKGREVLLPLMDRRIPVIFDAFVDSDFGTGVVKVTPGHDPHDFEAGRRHDLEVIKVIGEDGSITQAGGDYAGLDRYDARKKVVADLESQGRVEKVEEYSHNVGQCQRCETVVEPLVSRQWFVKVQPLAEEAIRAVEEGRIHFVPENYRRVYFEWMHNIHDWCISRQLWWGHRIPAWYCDDCDEVVVSREEVDTCPACGSSQLRQETDVLDTWFSSGLWPFSTLGWPEETRELEVFYPMSTMVTGFDIIFFWVARMIMMGLRFPGDVPFREVYINGLVRDEQGQKMSKSRGNIIDPLEVIDEYGTDAVRFTLAVTAVPGTDIPFSISRMSGYRAFCNKIWNAARFLRLNLETEEPVSFDDLEELLEEGTLELEHRWVLSRLNGTVAQVNRDLERYLIHEASNHLYHFFWGELCDWYLELVKTRFNSSDSEIRKRAETVASYVLETSLRLLHPFIPFITEELWQKVPHQGRTIMKQPYPEAKSLLEDEEAVRAMDRLQEFITAVRTARSEHDVNPRQEVDLLLSCSREARDFIETQMDQVRSLVRLGDVDFRDEFPEDRILIQGVTELADFAFFLTDVVDIEAEKSRLHKERGKIRNQLEGLSGKLRNESFLEKAPREVVRKARDRHEEVLTRLRRIEEKLSRFESAQE